MKPILVKIFKAVGIIFIVLAVVVLILFVYGFVTELKKKQPIKDIERNITITVTGDVDNNELSIYRTYFDMDTNQLTFYDDKCDALNDFSYITNAAKQYHVDELKFVKGISFDQAERLFYIMPMPKDNRYLLCIYDLILKDDMYSQLVGYDVRCVNFYDFEYIYEFDDAVVEGIYTDFRPVIKENGERVYCGFWDNKSEINSLSILGNDVNDITELKFDNGKTYYMWIATIPNYDEKIMEVEQPLTCRKFIKTFEIKYKKDKSIDNKGE